MLLDKLRKHPRVTAIVLAAFLALTAQYLFTGEIFTHQYDLTAWVWAPKYSVALVLLLLAIGLATWAAFPGDVEAVVVTPIRSSINEPEKRTWLISSVLCYILSIIIYLTIGENSLVRWLWLGGVLLLAIPLWLQSRNDPAEYNIPVWEWIVVGIISFIGFMLRYWKLTEIPSHVDNDVALMGWYALDLIRSGQNSLIGFSGSEHLLTYDQFMAWRMRLFGENHYGIVMFSVVLGTASLIFIYLLGRKLGGQFVGFISLGLLTISYTHIHFSRILFGNSSSFALIIVLYAFLKGLRTKEYFWFAIAGVFTGIGVLLYDSSRVIPLILISLFIWQWLWDRQSFKTFYKHWGILLAGFFFALGPMLAYAIQDFFNFSGRTNVVVVWNPRAWEHALSVYNTTNPLVVFLNQIWRTFLTLHLTGDNSPHFLFQRPMVDPLTALLFILGVGYGFVRIKDIKYFAILISIFLPFIFGGVLTGDPPYWPHLNIALPAIALVAALGAESLGSKIKIIYNRVGYGVYVWVLAGIIMVTGIQNWGIYYDYVKNNAGNRVRIARYVESLPNSYYVYLISDNFGWDQFSFRFFSQGTPGTDLTPEALVSAPLELKTPTVFILFRHPELVSTLENLYPDGIAENHYDANNLVSFISYRVIPSTVDAPPETPDVNPLNSPGWLMIFGLIIFWIGHVAYVHYSSIEAAMNNKQSIVTKNLE